MRIDDAVAFGFALLLWAGSALAIQFAPVALAALDRELAVVGVLFERGGGDNRLARFDDCDDTGGAPGGDVCRAGMNYTDVALTIDGRDRRIGRRPVNGRGIALLDVQLLDVAGFEL